jgi:hypothetical protein
MNRSQSVYKKIERAEEHIGGLDVWLCGLGHTKPYVLGFKPHPIPEINLTTIYVESIDEVGASLFIGDCLHNLRSAFDHLAWQLVEASGGVPNKDTFFPICNRSEQFAPAIGKGEIEKIRDGAKNLIRDIQPCHGGNELLWIIHELNRIDKHRYLLTTASAIADFGVALGPNQLLWMGQGFGDTRSFPLERGYEVMNIPAGTVKRQAKEDFKLAVEITFSQPEIVRGKPVIPMLKELCEFSFVTVFQFEQYLT